MQSLNNFSSSIHPSSDHNSIPSFNISSYESKLQGKIDSIIKEDMRRFSPSKTQLRLIDEIKEDIKFNTKVEANLTQSIKKLLSNFSNRIGINSKYRENLENKINMINKIRSTLISEAIFPHLSDLIEELIDDTKCGSLTNISNKISKYFNKNKFILIDSCIALIEKKGYRDELKKFYSNKDKKTSSKISKLINDCISLTTLILKTNIQSEGNNQLLIKGKKDIKYKIVDGNNNDLMYFKTSQINQKKSLTGGQASVYKGELTYKYNEDEIVTKKVAYKNFFINKSEDEINKAKIVLEKAHEKYKNLSSTQNQNGIINFYAKDKQGLYLELGHDDLRSVMNEIIDNDSLNKNKKSLFTLKYLLKFFQAVDKFHKTNHIHLDLKLENAVLIKDGKDTKVKLIDIAGIQDIKKTRSSPYAVTSGRIAPRFFEYFNINDQNKLNNFIEKKQVGNLAFLDIYSLGSISLKCYKNLRSIDSSKLLVQVKELNGYFEINTKKIIVEEIYNRTGKKIEYISPIDNTKYDNLSCTLKDLISYYKKNSSKIHPKYILSKITMMLLAKDPKIRVSNFKEILELLPKLFQEKKTTTISNVSFKKPEIADDKKSKISFICKNNQNELLDKEKKVLFTLEYLLNIFRIFMYHTNKKNIQDQKLNILDQELKKNIPPNNSDKIYEYLKKISVNDLVSSNIHRFREIFLNCHKILSRDPSNIKFQCKNGFNSIPIKILVEKNKILPIGYKKDNPLQPLENLIKDYKKQSNNVDSELILSQIFAMLLDKDPKKLVANISQILEHLPKLFQLNTAIISNTGSQSCVSIDDQKN